MATVRWITNIKNTGDVHDLIVGCSLLDPSSGEELVYFPWWRIFNVPSGNSGRVTIDVTGVPAGSYLGKCRAWTSYTGGTKVADLIDTSGNIVGAVYQAGTGTLNAPILDEMTQNITISGGISADITEFSLAVV